MVSITSRLLLIMIYQRMMPQKFMKSTENKTTQYADEDEEEHYATMIQDSVASIFPEEIPEVPPETDEPEKDVCSSELYAGTSRKLGVVLLMIFSLSIRFKLSDETLKYIISIIAMLLPFGHNMIKSVYVLK